MATALAVGREAAQTGELNIEELAGIINELYAEGFPNTSPFANESKSIATDPVDSHNVRIPVTLPEHFSEHSAIENAHAIYLQHMPDQPGQLEINELLMGTGISRNTDLNHVITEVNTHSTPSFSHGIEQRPVIPGSIAQSTGAEYYFLK
jgi:cysteine desulfurase/selenocysteine lyase